MGVDASWLTGEMLFLAGGAHFACTHMCLVSQKPHAYYFALKLHMSKSISSQSPSHVRFTRNEGRAFRYYHGSPNLGRQQHQHVAKLHCNDAVLGPIF